MEKAKKNLKTSSLIVLLFAGLTLFKIVTELIYGAELNQATIPEGAPENILMITKLFLLGLTIFLLIPHLYIGLRGLYLVKKPGSSATAAIVVAWIMFAVAVAGGIGGVIDMVKGATREGIRDIAQAMLDGVIMYEFIRYAREVSTLAKKETENADA